MNKTSHIKYKKKKCTKKNKYRLHKRSYKYKGGDIAFNLNQILGIVQTNSNPTIFPQPFQQY